MYWLIKAKQTIKTAGTIFSAVFIFSCSPEPTAISQDSAAHFDIPLFFNGQIELLANHHETIIKTVSKNEESETRDITIKDWTKELDSFVAIDINKAAYKGYIQKDSTGKTVDYRVTNPDLEISAVQITYDDLNKPYSIRIHKKITNLLYDTEEKLLYVCDSLYKIEKKQDVWLLGSNHYTIQGQFKKSQK